MDPRSGEKSCQKTNAPLWILSHRSPLHSPWGPALPEALTSRTGPGGRKQRASHRAWLPHSSPSRRSLLPAYPGSLLSAGSRKTRKSEGPLVKMEKEKHKSQEREAQEGPEGQERWWRRGVRPGSAANPCCSRACPLLHGTPLLCLPVCPASRCPGRETGRGYEWGITSPWGPGVQDSRADQEHPACPAEGQGAIRSWRSHRHHSIPRDPNPQGREPAPTQQCAHQAPAPHLRPRVAGRVSPPPQRAGVLPPCIWRLKSATQSGP